MEEIHELRGKHRADVVILIVDDPKGCGLATQRNRPILVSHGGFVPLFRLT
jgi:hypothetical protein